MNIVVPDPIKISPQYRAELEQLGAIFYEDMPKTTQEAIERIRDAELITANYLVVTPEIIDAAPRLRYIVTPNVGFNQIDVTYARSKGITVVNCPTFVTLPVAEHALALMLALAKRLTNADQALKKGLWDTKKFVGVQLEGKKLGLVGYGNIGKKVDSLATTLGMIVRHVDSKAGADELDHLLTDSDFVCLCLPLNSRTHHVIDARRLGLLKPSAFLINVARGAVIDQSALIKSLKRGDFAGAGLDVFENEPDKVQAKLPTEVAELIALDTVIATPHNAPNTPETWERRGRELCDDIKACLAGSPINVVN